jgi:hypothetical protein
VAPRWSHERTHNDVGGCKAATGLGSGNRQPRVEDRWAGSGGAKAWNELTDRIKQSQWWVARSETGSRRIDVAEFIEFCVGCGVDPAAALTDLAKRRR